MKPERCPEPENCWQVEKCGREMGGRHAEEFGICPAATERRLHGVNGGTNAGRVCWVVAGTLCSGKVQGTFSKKAGDCMMCGFHLQVAREEGPDMESTRVSLARLKP